MAKNTRSSAKSLCGSDETLTNEEAEMLRRNLADKEKRLNDRAESIRQQQIELTKAAEDMEREKEKQKSINTEDLYGLFESIKKEFKAFKELPERIRELSNRVDNIQIHEPPNQYSEDSYFPSSPHLETTPSAPANSPVEQPPFRLKEIIDTIPKYDGQRMSVFQFCKICERALEMIPPQQEKYLIQIITSRLQGHAYTVIEDGFYPKLSDLLHKLKQIFGPNKSLNQYRGELGNAYMKHNESIFDYIARIKELRMAIMDCETEQNRLTCSVDHDVLESFINGLPSDLLIRVKLEGYYSLDDAFTKVIQLSKTLETEAARRKPSFPSKTPPIPRRDYPTPASNTTDEKPPVPQYSILKRPNVPFSRGGPLIKPLIPGQPGPNAPVAPFDCYYCKSPGHRMAQCQKLAYRQQKYGSTSREPVQVLEQHRDSGNGMNAPVASGVRRDEQTTGRQAHNVHFPKDVEGIHPREASEK